MPEKIRLSLLKKVNLEKIKEEDIQKCSSFLNDFLCKYVLACCKIVKGKSDQSILFPFSIRNFVFILTCEIMREKNS